MRDREWGRRPGREQDRSQRSAQPWRTAARWLLVALLALGLASPALGQDEDDDDRRDDPFAGIYKKDGLYLSALATYAIPVNAEDAFDRDADAMFGPSSTEVENAWGIDARVGYRFHPRISLESQFEWLPAIESDVRNAMGDFKTDVGLFALTGNAKAYLLTERFQPYVVAGAGWARSRVDPSGSPNQRDDGFVWRAGGGFDLYGSPDVALSVEASFVDPTGDLNDLEYVSISAGLTLRFYTGGRN